MTDKANIRLSELQAALENARRHLPSDPSVSQAQAVEILRSDPGNRNAIVLLAASLRLQGSPQKALGVLEPLIRQHPPSPEVDLEAALSMWALGLIDGAIPALRRALAANPNLTEAWGILSGLLSKKGDMSGARRARAEQIKASAHDEKLIDAALSLGDNQLAEAERKLTTYLASHPENPAALRMLAETQSRSGRLEEAEAALTKCLHIAEEFHEARYNRATVLYRLNRSEEALMDLDRLMTTAPDHAGYRNLRAAVLGRTGDYEGAIRIYDTLLKSFPDQPRAWMSFGHSLKTVGRQADAVQAYRRAIALAPTLGEAWWSLANLKTVGFSDEDIQTMIDQLSCDPLEEDDRFHLHFALGKAFEDKRSFEASFEHYAKGAALRRNRLDYDANNTTAHAQRSRAVLSNSFFAERETWGDPAPDPIFIVGLPRAGSTLIEQILSSHSAVEGTMELPDIIAMARRIGGRHRREEPSSYPEALLQLDQQTVRDLGKEYLERTRIQRKLGRPMFIDKMPNNFAHAGFIHLILPRARIIDARRHPMGCCFSAFKQHFARGQAFSYDLTDLGLYYRDYVDLMNHWDEAMPGAVHRVIYEDLIADPEAEVRRLLAYCNLEFEPGCMRFHENERAVRTASSEQVRKPLFTDAVDHWRSFEPWLTPLRNALGPTLMSWNSPTASHP